MLILTYGNIVASYKKLIYNSDILFHYLISIPFSQGLDEKLITKMKIGLKV